MGRILKSYFFWTYERGSFHYDVMVTLILAFIFITPFVWNYGDRPQEEKLQPGAVLVTQAAPGEFLYVIPASQVRAENGSMDAQLGRAVEAVAGAVTVERYEAVKEPHGKVTAYRVWAHR